MHELQTEQTAGGILFTLLLLLAVFWIAQRNRFFHLPLPSPVIPITFRQVLGAFLTYLVYAFIILPISVLFLAYLTTGEIRAFKDLPTVMLGWLQLSSLFIIFFLFILYVFCIKRESRKYIFWGEGEQSLRRFLKGVGMGILTWAISYPFVLAVSLLARYLSLWIWGEIKMEQVAVKQLKMTMGTGYLFYLMVFAIVILVPFIEELLFRGFLQNFLKRYLGRAWAIVLSAIIFSLAHFSISQGIGNFQLIVSLSVLALFLGFIYERQRMLWSSMALHMTFNAFSIAMIILGIE